MAGGEFLEGHDQRRYESHHKGRRDGRKPPAVCTSTAGAPGHEGEREGEHRDGHLDIAQVGEEFGGPVGVDQGAADALVEAHQGAVGDDLPGDQREEEGRKP